MKPLNRSTLLNITIIVEAILLLLATAWSYLAGLQLMPAFVFSYKAMLIGCGAGVAMALTGYALFLISSRVPMLGQLHDIVHNNLIPLVADLKPLDILVVAMLSGFCEEVFFRGVAQQQFGIVITSLAFGIFHDPSFRHVSYSILACLYGFALGYLFQYTGSIWAPIFAHTVHNLISLFILRYRVKPPAAPVSEV